MKFEGFIGGSYESRAITADQERTINWYPEMLQSPGAPSQKVLYPTPGVEIIQTTLDGAAFAMLSPGRAHLAIDGREFAVAGTSFYELGSNGEILAGTTASPNDGQPATISSNGDGGGQLFITTGGNAYTADTTNNPILATSAVVALAGKAHFGAHLDGYFLALDTNTSTLYVSELYDGATWNTGTMFAQRSLGPDKWKSIKVVGRAVWLFGEQTSEIWYNSGDRFPLSPMANQVVPYGIAAPWSAETVGGSIFWLASNRDGKVCVMRSSGSGAEIISTYPLEMRMQEYVSRNNAVADSYSDAGHSFYMLNFDADNITWCYDTTTGLWHERGTWDPESIRYASWRPRFYAYAYGEHRMLDTSNGNLYRMSTNLTRDVDGRMIRRMRRAPGIQRENKRIFYHEFEVDLEPGPGISGCQVGFTMSLPLLQLGEIVVDDSEPANEGIWFTDISVPIISGPGDPGDYQYEWSFWGDMGGTEEAPAYTSTDVAPVLSHIVPICASYAKVRVFHPQTAALAQKQPAPFTAHCP